MVDPYLGWIALFSPLAACILITACFLNAKNASSLTAIIGILISFVCTVLLALQVFHVSPAAQVQQSVAWLHTSTLTIGFGVLINPLAIMMLMIVTGVGSAIFIYSRGYMDDDPCLPRFFAYLSLFAFSMIGIVLSNNFIQLFIFWELVGLSSYLLIGFWYENPSAADAGVKAFMVNRLADFGFFCGILLLWSVSDMGHGRSFVFTDLAQVVPHLAPHLLAIIALLVFCGVVGKSAQVPLHVWLPDAMEGPTPVSALIHAATMVAAGIYLVARVYFLFQPLSSVLTFVAYVGGITAFMAATMAIVENDIKRILAYSTLSQLGYMVMALGLGGPLQGMYHLTTHAFFKALLFLAAGSVILAVHHEQDIWKMKGLLKHLPITGWTFLIGTLALCGIFPFSGFWSKDEILALAASHSPLLCWVGTITGGLTSFYMGRLFLVAFWGQSSSSHAHGHQPHESPAIMTIPLIVLAIFSAFGGFLGIPHLLYPQQTLEPLKFGAALTATLVAVSGLVIAYLIYGRRPVVDPLVKWLGPIYTLLKNKYYFDMAYDWYVNVLQQSFARFLLWCQEVFIVRWGVHGAVGVARATGNVLRYLQTGLIQFYALFFVLGVIYLFYVMVSRLY